ncbi:Phosphatase and actin regulator 4 [Balamuthia mandrillaris]
MADREEVKAVGESDSEDVGASPQGQLVRKSKKILPNSQSLRTLSPVVARKKKKDVLRHLFHSTEQPTPPKVEATSQWRSTRTESSRPPSLVRTLNEVAAQIEGGRILYEQDRRLQGGRSGSSPPPATIAVRRYHKRSGSMDHTQNSMGLNGRHKHVASAPSEERPHAVPVRGNMGRPLPVPMQPRPEGPIAPPSRQQSVAFEDPSGLSRALECGLEHSPLFSQLAKYSQLQQEQPEPEESEEDDHDKGEDEDDEEEEEEYADDENNEADGFKTAIHLETDKIQSSKESGITKTALIKPSAAALQDPAVIAHNGISGSPPRCVVTASSPTSSQRTLRKGNKKVPPTPLKARPVDPPAPPSLTDEMQGQAGHLPVTNSPRGGDSVGKPIPPPRRRTNLVMDAINAASHEFDSKRSALKHAIPSPTGLPSLALLYSFAGEMKRPIIVFT